MIAVNVETQTRIRSTELKQQHDADGEQEHQELPFMMYSFSADPGSESALNKLLSSCSVKGAISAGVILKHRTVGRVSAAKLWRKRPEVV